MKKKLSYRDKLLELANIYKVKEIQEYIKRRKNLTIGQIELILRKNKIVVPKDFQTTFYKENFYKPFTKTLRNTEDLVNNSVRSYNKLLKNLYDITF